MEQPSAASRVSAFPMPAGVMKRRAFQPRRTAWTARSPVFRAKISREEKGAGMVPSPGNESPRHSVRQLIEFAVKRPAHEPQVGQASSSRAQSSSALNRPRK